MREGQILALLAGPPCNTWSRVRRVQLAADSRDHHGPRAIRSPQHPWALPSLCLRELQQIIFGNTLLLFAIHAFYVLLLAGGCGLIEHPDEATDEDVSIWRVPLIAALRRHADVGLWHVTQGFHGSEGRKPTGFLSLRMPGLLDDLNRWQLATWHHQGQTSGRDSHGSFHSSKLKEYPPALCASLADTFARALSQRAVSAGVVFPKGFREICERLINSSKGTCMGPDSHRTD
eukprot:Skav209401  [mRNA]  locus=scaffold962:136896:137591:- [translate_table: standard]